MTDEEADELGAMLDKPYEEYWYELGRFIHQFSAIESILQNLVHHFAGVTDDVGKAVAYGLRVDNAREMINRILDATGRPEVKQRLAGPFAQLGTISTMRNHIVHWGARETNRGLLISNERIAFTPEKMAFHPVSADDLKLMRGDLQRIFSLLLIERYADEPKSPFSADAVREVKARTWLYKRPQPIPRRSKTPKPKPIEG